MNNQRRKQLQALSRKSQSVWSDAEDLKCDLETLLEEEREAFDAMPESIQAGERGQKMEEAIAALEEAVSGVEEAVDRLNEISGHCEIASA